MKNTTFILKYNSKFDFQILLILTVYDCLKNGFFFKQSLFFVIIVCYFFVRPDCFMNQITIKSDFSLKSSYMQIFDKQCKDFLPSLRDMSTFILYIWSGKGWERCRVKLLTFQDIDVMKYANCKSIIKLNEFR